MQRFLIKCVNGAVLIVILIGVPAATRAQFGQWQISSAPTAQKVTFWGLGIAAVVNVLAATLFIKGRKEQSLCALWAFIFGGFLLFEYGLIQGWFNFNWLKNSLLWLQKHF